MGGSLSLPQETPITTVLGKNIQENLSCFDLEKKKKFSALTPQHSPFIYFPRDMVQFLYFAELNEQ